MVRKKRSQFYTVWAGRQTGVFDSWDQCQVSVQDFRGAKFKGFDTESEAEQALQDGPDKYWGANTKPRKKPITKKSHANKEYELNSWCVDAAWNATSKVMEYRGVCTRTKQIIFSQGPFEMGTNNIGEFLAIVHALAILKGRNDPRPVYSDSTTAIKWVTQCQANSHSIKAGNVSGQVIDLVNRAEKWLQDNEYQNKVLKWESQSWGENPADFDRK